MSTSRPFIGAHSKDKKPINLAVLDNRYVNEIMDKDLNMNQHKITNTKEGEDENDVCTIKNLRVYYRKGTALDMDGKQIKNVADGTNDQDVCTVKQARLMVPTSSTRMVILNTKIIGSNKYLYYILKTFPETEYVHILSLLIKSPTDNRFHELHKTPEMGFITVYTMEKLHDIHPLLSIEAEKSFVDPTNGLETSQFLNKDGIIFYCEKTPSVSLKTYYITENSISWIHLRVVYLTCQLNE